MIKIATARLTEPYWFKVKNKCKYYDISMSDVMVSLLVKFAETTELDHIMGIPDHGRYNKDS